ncbi:hypothetical protein AgCh_006537 [Apium graveolens]
MNSRYLIQILTQSFLVLIADLIDDIEDILLTSWYKRSTCCFSTYFTHRMNFALVSCLSMAPVHYTLSQTAALLRSFHKSRVLGSVLYSTALTAGFLLVHYYRFHKGMSRVIRTHHALKNNGIAQVTHIFFLIIDIIPFIYGGRISKPIGFQNTLWFLLIFTRGFSSSVFKRSFRRKCGCWNISWHVRLF